jgi:formylglycine-generating enzyme required for sulfatase activity
MHYAPILVLSAYALISSCDDSVNPVASTMIAGIEFFHIENDLSIIIGPSWEPGYSDEVDSLPIATMSPYYIAKYELTNYQYSQFVDSGGYTDSAYWSHQGWITRSDSNWTRPKYWGSGEVAWEDDPYSPEHDTPVHAISYYEAEAYCNWLSLETGEDFHLPNSAQWIRAAKGPDPGTQYPWGNSLVEANAYYPLFRDVEFVAVSSYSVGKSGAGCYQMIGNVYEFCTSDDSERDAAIIRSSYHWACSTPPCMQETMTTISGMRIGKGYQRDFVGIRLCL